MMPLTDGNLLLPTFYQPNPIDGRSDRSKPMALGIASAPAGSEEAYFCTAAAILGAQPDRGKPDASAALLDRHYGLAGTVTILSSEVERTAEIRPPDGRR